MYKRQELGIAEDEVLGSDLYVYNRDQGRIMGADDSLIGSPRLDDLQDVYKRQGRGREGDRL